MRPADVSQVVVTEVIGTSGVPSPERRAVGPSECRHSDHDHFGKSVPCDLCLHQTQAVHRSYGAVGQALDCSEFAGDHPFHHVHTVSETLGFLMLSLIGADVGISGQELMRRTGFAASEGRFCFGQMNAVRKDVQGCSCRLQSPGKDRPGA